MSIPDPLIGSQLGDYRIVDILGRGGMARVYRGYDAKLERYAAVKVIDAYLTSESEEEYRQRFQREARAIAKLNHPRIVGVYQFGQKDTLYYMAMAFIEGRDLGHILKDFAQQGKMMSYRDVLRVMRDVSSALDHAHTGGVIHRDVKPSNIMITPDGHAVLTDFGLALSVPEGSIGNTFGSAHYIAPEQAVSSANAVPQSDYYSLGIVLYQMLVGKVPFDDPSAMSVALKHLSEPPPPLRNYNSEITPQVESVVLRLLEKEPTRRFANGDDFVAALEAAFGVSSDSYAAVRSTSELAQVVANHPSTHSATPVFATQISKPSALRLEAAKAAPPAPVKKANRAPLLVIGTMVALLVIVGVVVAALASSTGGRATLTPSPTAAELVSAGQTLPVAASTDEAETEAAEPTRRPSATPRATAIAAAATETGEVLPSEDATEAVLTSDETAESDATEETDATATRTPRATQRPSRTPRSPASNPTPVEVTPVPPAIASEDGVLTVIYNPNEVMLVNGTDGNLDLSNLQFTQAVESGNPLTFRTTVFNDAWRLEPNSCFQVFTNHFVERPVPDGCGFRQGWRAVSLIRWFWRSTDEDATFTVVRGSETLAECEISAGRCTVDLNEDEA